MSVFADSRRKKLELLRNYLKRFCWLLALLLATAACGRGGQSGELPRAGFKVVFESHSVPKEMNPNAQATADVRLRNASSSTWPSKPNEKKKFDVQLSYHWLGSNGEMLVYDGVRTALPHDVKPGTSVEVHAVIQAPPRPGSYILELTLVQEGKAWFSEIDNDSKVSVPVLVTDGKPASGQDGRAGATSADSSDGKSKKARKERKRDARAKASNDEPASIAKRDGSWAIQVGSFSDEREANTSAAQLKNKGYDAFVVKSEIKGKNWYRVRVGRLASRAEAEKLQKQLASQERTDQSLIVANR